MSSANFIPFFTVLPLLSAFLISLIGKYTGKSVVKVISLVTCSLLLALSFWAVFRLRSSGPEAQVYNVGGWQAPFGICMVIDGLSAFMLTIVNTIAFFVCIFSFRYMEKYTDIGKYFTLFFLMLVGMNGVIVTGDLFNLFVFLEVASIASYSLVAFGTRAEELEASFKYAVMGTVASSFIFLAIAVLYGFTSTLNMADMARVLSTKQNPWIISFVSVLFLAGFGLKGALAPFHAWLPDAHSSAPASISAMLSSVLIKTLGIYSILRIFFNVIGLSVTYSSALMFLGALSMLGGVILVISQWDLKRFLAYSSISQIGYIFLAIGLGTPLGIFAGLFHLLNHSIFKCLLFLNSGAIDYATGKRDLREMSGLRQSMPVTSATNFIASMSISGIPPFSGFFSKFMIILACLQEGRLGYAFLAALVSILTLSSFMKMRKFVFLGEPKEKREGIKEAPWSMKFSMVGLSVLCLLGGLLLFPHFKFFITNAVDVLMEGREYTRIVLGGK